MSGYGHVHDESNARISSHKTPYFGLIDRLSKPFVHRPGIMDSCQLPWLDCVSVSLLRERRARARGTNETHAAGKRTRRRKFSNCHFLVHSSAYHDTPVINLRVINLHPRDLHTIIIQI